MGVGGVAVQAMHHQMHFDRDCLHLRPAEGDLGRGKSRDEVVALGGSHPHTGVGLAVQLPPHKEVALLLEVDVAVGAHEAAGVAEFVPGFDHRPPGARGTRQTAKSSYPVSTNR